jgi:hypothetical protein
VCTQTAFRKQDVLHAVADQTMVRRIPSAGLRRLAPIDDQLGARHEGVLV